MESSIVQKAIEQLVLEGYTILQIITPSGVLYFSVYKWQEGYFNTAQSIDFNMCEGVNITEFLQKNAPNCFNRVEFLNKFNQVIDEGVLVHLEFTKGSEWFKWSAPNGTKKF